MTHSKTCSKSGQQKIVTLADVAKRCGVSTMTVSRAMRDDRSHLSAETLARIKSVVAEMGYDPRLHQGARRLALRKHGKEVLNKNIAFVLPANYLQHPYYSSILNGVLNGVLDKHFGLQISHEITSGDIVFPELISRGEVDGLIYYAVSPHFDAVLQRIREQTLFGERPVVRLNAIAQHASAVVFDEFTGGYLQAAHLLDMGHRHVLHFYAEETGYLKQRLDGCRQAYCDRHLDPDAYLHNVTHFIPESAARYTDWYYYAPAVLDQTRSTAIITRYDRHAQYIYRALKQHGYRVPEDISLIGYNDTDAILNDLGENILTTVRLPLMTLGERAAKLIIQRVTGQLKTDTNIVIPVELVVRQSVIPLAP